MSRAMVDVTCPRCGGSGFIPRFGWYAKGLCFRCQGAGKVKMRAAPDGSVDHDHQTMWPGCEDRCALCGLPVADWPPVVIAKWWDLDARWQVFLPDRHGEDFVAGETRRKAQNEARRLILGRVPNARIKWTVA